MPQYNDFQVTWNVKVDLLVLRYMARKIAYFLLDAAASTTLPQVYFAQEQRNRIHRIVIYRKGKHLLNGSLLFVGFISGVQEHASPATVQEIHRVDKQFMAELANNTGLLSYSSLELKRGRWFNLVLLSDLAAKTFFKESTTHSYAAYQLSTQYYAWIRLHHGVLPGGLERKDFVVQRTKYYVFPEIGQQPVTRELRYEVSRVQDALLKESVPIRPGNEGAIKHIPTTDWMENEGAIKHIPTTGWMENEGAINCAPTEAERTEKEEVALDERG
jgi:hypothetical protein